MDKTHLCCIICLDQFKVPVTIPCGHNFCQKCINLHWDTEEAAGKGFYCPTCRMSFDQRPPLNKNVTLSFLLESSNSSDWAPASVQSKGDAGTCRQHSKPLDVYCRTERVCVCSECMIQNCKEHDCVTVENERKDRKVELNEKNKQLIKQINDTSRSIVELRDNIANTKVSLDQSSEWVKTKFTQLLKSMMEMQEAVQLSIDKERQSVVTEAEERLALLEERAEQLRNKQEQIETLQTLPDVNFLQETQVIQVPRMKKVPLNVSSDLQNKLHKVTGVLSNISKLVSEDLQKVVSVVGAQDRKDSPEDKQTPEYVVPNTTAPANPLSVKSHHAHYRNLLFDLNTANVNIKVSLGKRKAEHVTTGVQNYPPHEARFEHMWQVLCAEGLRDGQHYWEVEVSRYWAYLGVTYSSIPRKEKSKSSILGMNKVSWSLQLFERQLCAWHAGKKEVVTGKAQYKRIGMLLDWQAGTLTYYGDGHTRLHTFHCAFSQELYPAFFIGEEVSITLCPP